MTFSARSMIFSAGFNGARGFRRLLSAALLAAIAMGPGAAEARRYVRAGAYDGTWNVVFSTRAGNCSSTNSVPFAVYGTRVSSAGGGKVTGGISRSGGGSGAHSLRGSHARRSGRRFGQVWGGRPGRILTGGCR